MVLKSNKKRPTQKEREKRRRDRLNLALVLLLFWLVLCLAFGYFYIKTVNREQQGTDMASASEKGNTGVYFELLEATDRAADPKPSTSAAPETTGNLRFRDEFQPTMESLLRERGLARENIKSGFRDRLAFKESKPMHTTDGEKVVYIYHSHSREAFLPDLKNVEKPQEAYHATANVTIIGKMLGEALERRGIGAQVNDSDIVKELDVRGLDYGSSYPVSREHVQAARKENDGLEIFLDIHRDSLRKDSTTASIQGNEFAQLLFVVGTGHPAFKKNLAFTAGLHQKINEKYPGLSKGILEKDSSQGNGVYNQDLAFKSVIIEFGGVDNTAEEINRTVNVFAEVLSDYYWHGEK